MVLSARQPLPWFKVADQVYRHSTESFQHNLSIAEMDKTHWNWEGSYVFGRMVAADMAKAVPELARYVLLSQSRPLQIRVGSFASVINLIG